MGATKERYYVRGKCFSCGKPVHKAVMYCSEACRDRIMREGGECELCGLLTKPGEKYCSQDCEDEAKGKALGNKIIANLDDTVVFKGSMIEVNVGCFPDGLRMAIDFEGLDNEEHHIEIDLSNGQADTG